MEWNTPIVRVLQFPIKGLQILKTPNLLRVGSFLCCLPHAQHEGILQWKVNFAKIMYYTNDIDIMAL